MEFLQNQFFILGAIVLVGFAAGGWLFFDLRRKLRRVFGEKIPEDVQIDTIRRVRELETEIAALAPRVDLLEKIASVSVQKVGFIRFNPFQDTGGDNSFTLALLDRENNGVVVSSLYMREGTRLYAKQIRQGAAKQPLSDEEQGVLEQALKGKSQ